MGHPILPVRSSIMGPSGLLRRPAVGRHAACLSAHRTTERWPARGVAHLAVQDRGAGYQGRYHSSITTCETVAEEETEAAGWFQATGPPPSFPQNREPTAQDVEGGVVLPEDGMACGPRSLETLDSRIRPWWSKKRAPLGVGNMDRS